MKRSYFLLLTIISAAVLSGCAKENTTEPRTFTTLRASITETRAAWTQSEKGFWQKDDMIAVFDNSAPDTSYPYMLIGDGNVSHAEFSGGLVLASDANVDIIAAYPYSSGLTLADNKISYSIPSTQTYVNDGIDGMPMVARYQGKGADLSLSFHQVATVIRIPVRIAADDPATQMTVKKIYLRKGDNANISMYGQCNMTAVDGVTGPTTEAGIGVAEFTLDCGEGVTITKDAPVYFNIAVGASSSAYNGLSLKFEIEGMDNITKTNNAVYIFDTPGTIYTLKNEVAIATPTESKLRFTIDDITFVDNNTFKVGDISFYRSGVSDVKANNGKINVTGFSYFYNTTPLPGNITKVVFDAGTDYSRTLVKFGTEAVTSANSSTGFVAGTKSGENTITNGTADCKYFAIRSGMQGTNISYIEVYYE